MPVLDAVQTFVGITYENEFYSHHYLAEVLTGDLKERTDAWQATEDEHPGDDAFRAPFKALQSWRSTGSGCAASSPAPTTMTSAGACSARARPGC
jgi:hypothetical protein